ncbi:hypothetical protein IscW_ISCW000225 [Ixodes scapularis]|uniref:Uncharacterized protein n=1 Tax=Ixodes scapularis TaxID=6945 RepID=B7P3K0_IXOSC|nr:hypothetical protein IscW_ISCW000225 [Ixodes scapularis]|eukprot:XP_002404327.1 hypothetical protein IscW_ISCW000225 [Ixodes scapularis]
MYGSFVLKHPALRGAHSQFLGPSSAVSYLISLVWSEQTFNSPAQLWKASSTHSFKDYQGAHTLELVPCLASADQDYAYPPEGVCSPLDPIR